MTPIIKIPIPAEPETELESLKDCAATQRALDYYLKPSVSQHVSEKKVFQVCDGLSQEEALVHASDYLRCAIASTQGAVEYQQSVERDFLMGILFFMESSKQLVDTAIDAQQLSAR
jgi:hypothetical protein